MPRRLLSKIGDHELTDLQVGALARRQWRDDDPRIVELLGKYYRVVLDSLAKKGLFAVGRQGRVSIWTRSMDGFRLAQVIEGMVRRGEVEQETTAQPAGGSRNGRR